MLPMGAITDEREQDLGQSLGEPPVRNSMNSMLVLNQNWSGIAGPHLQTSVPCSSQHATRI